MLPNQEEFIKKMTSIMDERTRRLFLGGYSTMLDYGGVSELSRCSKTSRTTITAGAREYARIDSEAPVSEEPAEKRIRQSGGGRRRITDTHPELLDTLYSFMDGNTRDYPNSPLCWTTKSLKAIQEEFLAHKISISITKLRQLLNEQDFDARRRKNNSSTNPDAIYAQYDFIRQASHRFLKNGLPVIYMDINPTNSDFTGLSALAVDAVALWWHNIQRLQHDFVDNPSAMIILGSHKCSLIANGICAAIGNKTASVLGKDILISALPEGISKWMYHNEILSLYSGLIELHHIYTPVRHTPVDVSTKRMISSTIAGKASNSDMNYYFRSK